MQIDITLFCYIHVVNYCVVFAVSLLVVFLPRCAECRRGLAMRILSVCLSVYLSHA